MNILRESDRLREQFCLAAERDGATPSPDIEQLLTEYTVFLTTVKKSTLTASEIQAVCDLNTVSVDTHIQLAAIPTDINLNFCRAALDWNLGHAERISADTLVCTYRLQGHIDFTLLGEELSTILANLDKAIAIAYCDQTLAFSTVGEVFKLRSRILAKMGRPLESKTAAFEADYLFDLEKDYQKYIREMHRPAAHSPQ